MGGRLRLPSPGRAGKHRPANPGKTSPRSRSPLIVIPMAGFDDDLRGRLDALEEAGLRRTLLPLAGLDAARVAAGEHPLVNFASNDYLGLSRHPALLEAARQALRDEGAGSGASRLMSGSRREHARLEQCLADWKRTGAALSFPSGFAAALGAIPALVERGDFVVLDRLVHACCIDAARLSGATLRVFRHNDPEDLDRLLGRINRHRSVRRPRILVVTEGVFSMDGDAALLSELVRVKESHGAWLMVDEAHSTGLFGASRSGLVEEAGLESRVEVRMGTLGKALGSAGGYLAGSRSLIDLLINRARSFIYTTAPVPAAAAAARAAIDVVRGAEGARLTGLLRARLHQLDREWPALPWTAPARPAAIRPILVGRPQAAVRLAARLREAGLLVPAIRFPTVPRGGDRLRLSLSAAHSPEDVTLLLQALREAAAAEST